MPPAADSVMGQAGVVTHLLTLFRSSDECTCLAHLQGSGSQVCRVGGGVPHGLTSSGGTELGRGLWRSASLHLQGAQEL